MHIRRDDLSGPEIRALLEVHLQSMVAASPSESMHALDLDGLRASDIAFWTVWAGQELLGCGALKQIDSQHGEIKSMRTQAKHRGQGVAQAMVAHIVAEAQRLGYTKLSLETGTEAEFAPARRLYCLLYTSPSPRD